MSDARPGGGSSASGRGGAPRRIGRYEVQGEVGRGGLGVVYRARDPERGDEVALKLLLHAGEHARRRLRREIRALARLAHPHLVGVRDVTEHRGRPVLVMDLVPGRSLEERLRASGRVEPRLAARWTRELARALEHAHGRGVLHRDLKPANVLLRDDGAALLVDFGLAKEVDASLSRLTRTGTFLGTPGYWSPEQATGELDRVGVRSDVYGLGATLYAALTGRPPLPSDSLQGALRAVAEDDPEPPSRSVPGLDPALERVCLRCLAKDPGARFASAAELARALERCERRPSPATPDRSRAGAAAAAIVGLGLAAAAATLLAGRLAAPPADGPPEAAAASPAGAARPDVPAEAAPSDPAPTATARSSAPRAASPAPRPRPPGWSERARALFQSGRLDALRALCREDLARDPDSALAHQWLGSALALEGRYPEAEERLTRALAAGAEDPNAYLTRGIVRRELGRTPGAIDDFGAALDRDPSLATAHLYRALCHHDRDDLESALTDFEAAARLRPDHAETQRHLGNALVQLGRLDAAEEPLARAVDLDPADAESWRVRGDLRVRQGRGEDALRAYEQARVLQPNLAPAWEGAAVALQMVGRDERALEAVERALRLDPRSARAHFTRASLLLAVDRPDEGAQALDRAIALRPGYGLAYLERAKLRRRRGDAAGARRDLERVQELEGGTLTGRAAADLRRRWAAEDGGAR